MSTSTRRSRIPGALAAVIGLSLLAGACGTDDESTTTTAPPDEGQIAEPLEADAGAAARIRRDEALGRADSAERALAVAPSADEMIAVDCGAGGEPWVPSPEEIATANADTDALAATLDTYGIAYDIVTDEYGFTAAEIDYTDAVAQSVVDSFWADRYPPEPIDPAELERVQAENDRIAAALDAVGVAYTRQSDEGGWEWVEWDYEDPDAQAAVDAVYAELYPPVPPSGEELESMRAENDRLAAAFDAAGIAYTRVSDTAGWEWIEWDYEDPATTEAAQAVFDELYPVEPLVDPIDCGFDDVAPVDEAPLDEVAVDPISIDPIEGGGDSGFTPEQIAMRDADVAAMTAGFDAAGVAYTSFGDSPWVSVVFDLSPAAVDVITGVLSAR